MPWAMLPDIGVVPPKTSEQDEGGAIYGAKIDVFVAGLNAFGASRRTSAQNDMSLLGTFTVGDSRFHRIACCRVEIEPFKSGHGTWAHSTMTGDAGGNQSIKACLRRGYLMGSKGCKCRRC